MPLEGENILQVKQLSKIYSKNKDEKIIALNELSFDLKKGEVLGVIGKNGAGKSTLLKVLSRITPPSSGSIEYWGTLCSIIDIGTGFHPDLSAKENVFLSASLLGLSKKETLEIYDGIVSFSELESYMDMPVKHFSSGMYLRLAFSIAFFSRIDILLLDEIIAVGDASFRRKCYQKIRDLKNSGVGIILVSHSMDAIVEFCDRCIWLNDGKALEIGSPISIVENYLEQALPAKIKGQNHSITAENSAFFGPFKNDFVSIESIHVSARNKRADEAIYIPDEIDISITCEKHQDEDSFEIICSLYNMKDILVLADSYGLREDYEAKELKKGQYDVYCKIPGHLLNRGVYRLAISIGKNQNMETEIPLAYQFKINAGEEKYTREIGSIIRPQLAWEINKKEAKSV